MRAHLSAALLVLASCSQSQEPERGSGVYAENPEVRMARRQAEFEAGEKLGLGELRQALRDLGLRPAEIVTTTEPDHGIEVLRLDIGQERLAGLDGDALARLVLDSNFRLEFADPVVARAVPTGEEIFRRDMDRAIAELRAHGDWNRVPRRRRGEALGSLAARIEDWCDFDRGQALRVIDGEWLEYTRTPVDQAVEEPRDGDATARFDCLIRAVYATQLRGLFIGYRGETPPPVY